MPPNENDLRCYVCGKPIENSLMLVSMQTDVDRVFVLHDGDCTEQVEAVVIVAVQRMIPKERDNANTE